MKTMNCDACDTSFSAENFEGWVEQMKPHYAQAHADVMASHATGNEEENMKKMKEWMDQAKQRWESVESEG